MKQWTISTFELTKIKKRAMRHGAWFKTLDRIDRAIVNLTIQCVEKIRSLKLAEIVTAILNKLKQNLESPIESLMQQVGLALAQKFGEIAQGWGNKSARLWADNFGFIKYLAVMQMNLSPIFRV